MARSSKFYDTNDVDIRLQYNSIQEIVDLIKDGALNIASTDIQRLSTSWKSDQRSLFIESLLVKIPIPPIYIDGSQKPWNVIDGLQRLNTIYDFVNDRFVLHGLEYLNEIEGKRFSDLPHYMRKSILDTILVAQIINPGTPKEVRFNIFKRINATGSPVNEQEIRNAFFSQKGSRFVNALAGEEVFASLLTPKYKLRMRDRELVSYYLSFKLQPYWCCEDVSKFLYAGIDKVEQLDENQLQSERQLFRDTIEVCRRVFGTDVFRMKGMDKGVLSKALFETLTSEVAKLPRNAWEPMERSRVAAKEKFALLFGDVKFVRCVTRDSNKSESIVYRHAAVQKMLKELI